jgi:hypothetical protein
MWRAIELSDGFRCEPLIHLHGHSATGIGLKDVNQISGKKLIVVEAK